MRNIHINNDDNYATPPEFYNELNKEFNFDFDPCPYNENEIQKPFNRLSLEECSITVEI